jgi:hypothetical protein
MYAYRCIIYCYITVVYLRRDMTLEEASVDAPWVQAAAKMNAGKVSKSKVYIIIIPEQCDIRG